MARTDNKGSAELRTWELNENSTRYDYLLAAPSDSDLTKYWTAWAAISLFFGLFTGVIFLGVLSSRNARRRAFNVYLLYLMFPDAVYSILCGIVCMIHAINNRQVASMCNFQMLFIVWGVGSSMWLNAAVTQQLYDMLRASDRTRKYSVPSIPFVTRQALAIYAFTIFLGTLGLIESNKFPHYVASTSGLACLPVEQDTSSSIFFWLFFFPAFGGIPIMYITYVCFMIWKRQLLPPKGKRRLLVIYFGRIVIVFILMWVPYMVLLFMFATWMPTWVHFAGGTLSHLQGATSAALSLLKPDLYVAVKRFLKCQCRDQSSSSGGGGGSSESESSSWMFNFASKSAKNDPPRTSSFWSALMRSNPPESETSGHIDDNVVESNNISSLDDDDDSDALADSIWPDENGEYCSTDTQVIDDNEDEEEGDSQQALEASSGS